MARELAHLGLPADALASLTRPVEEAFFCFSALARDPGPTRSEAIQCLRLSSVRPEVFAAFRAPMAIGQASAFSVHATTKRIAKH